MSTSREPDRLFLDFPLPTETVRCSEKERMQTAFPALYCAVCEDSPEKYYRCARCGRQVPVCFGATDGTATDEWCDDCWAAAYDDGWDPSEGGRPHFHFLREA